MKVIKISKYLLPLLLLFSLAANAQYYSFGNGLPIKETEYAEVAGTPFLIDSWRIGSVVFADNKFADNLHLKYNIKDDEVYYQDPNGETMRFKDQVKAFTLIDNGKIHSFQKGYSNYKNLTADSYLEVVVSGKTQLLEKKTKTIAEGKTYPSETIEKRFLDVNSYYIFSKNKIESIKKDKKSIFAAIGDKQPELEAYVKTNNLNLKNDDDLAKLIIYYNSL